ncbi:hypothetical protein FRB95_004655 [Tulasnella sp. JGI-2019a]|nr:hypothetical protein FRB95_004655 [Tulasnella sp. JGI-2019a]
MRLFAITTLALFFIVVVGQIPFKDCSEWNDDRQICVQGNLYLDGTVAAEVTTDSDSLFHGCRGGAVAVGVDAAGRGIWSVVLEGKTACGLTDIFCRSTATRAVVAHIDAGVAPQTARVDFYYEFNVNTLHGRQLQWIKHIRDAL